MPIPPGRLLIGVSVIGSTSDFGSVSKGSSPLPQAKTTNRKALSCVMGTSGDSLCI